MGTARTPIRNTFAAYRSPVHVVAGLLCDGLLSGRALRTGSSRVLATHVPAACTDRRSVREAWRLLGAAPLETQVQVACAAGFSAAAGAQQLCRDAFGAGVGLETAATVPTWLAFQATSLEPLTAEPGQLTAWSAMESAWGPGVFALCQQIARRSLTVVSDVPNASWAVQARRPAGALAAEITAVVAASGAANVELVASVAAHATAAHRMKPERVFWWAHCPIRWLTQVAGLLTGLSADDVLLVNRLVADGMDVETALDVVEAVATDVTC